MSNSTELMKLISESEESTTVPMKLVLEEDETYANPLCGPCGTARDEDEHKTLGIIWNHREDTLVMRLSTFSYRTAKFFATTRNVLRVTASIYDPLGLISPVVILMKTLFQELCSDKREGDESLEGTLAKQ